MDARLRKILNDYLEDEAPKKPNPSELKEIRDGIAKILVKAERFTNGCVHHRFEIRLPEGLYPVVAHVTLNGVYVDFDDPIAVSPTTAISETFVNLLPSNFTGLDSQTQTLIIQKLVEKDIDTKRQSFVPSHSTPGYLHIACYSDPIDGSYSFEVEVVEHYKPTYEVRLKKPLRGIETLYVKKGDTSNLDDLGDKVLRVLRKTKPKKPKAPARSKKGKTRRA